ncbi:MAG: glycine cleavage system protein H [Sulfobacillus thermosulfidooxidans]|nr:MAG: glycine cleavage system protein H [Sulfobacillus thermosulfidooxidans]
MAQVFACEFPDVYWFDVERDVWVMPQPSGQLRMGMTDPAQTRAGKVLHVRAKTGKTVVEGQNLATIESAKWVGPFPAPCEGLVVAVNPIVMTDPNEINRDPYGQGWIVELQPSSDVWSSTLMTGPKAIDAYREKLRAEGLTCMRCVPPSDDLSPESEE